MYLSYLKFEKKLSSKLGAARLYLVRQLQHLRGEPLLELQLLPGEVGQHVVPVVAQHQHNLELDLRNVMVEGSQEILVFGEKVGQTRQIVSIQLLHLIGDGKVARLDPRSSLFIGAGARAALPIRVQAQGVCGEQVARALGALHPRHVGPPFGGI